MIEAVVDRAVYRQKDQNDGGVRYGQIACLRPATWIALIMAIIVRPNSNETYPRSMADHSSKI